MEELNHTEEAIMRILWDISEGVVHDVIARLPAPKPPYTTVSSTIRLLEKKGYVKHKAYGKTHVYFPAIERDVYARKTISEIVQHYFDGSPKNVVSFLVQEKALNPEEIEELHKLIESYRKA